MRVLVLWAQISRYMGASWRSLAAVDGVDLHVIATLPGPSARAFVGSDSDRVNANAPYSRNVMDGVPSTLLTLEELRDFRRLEEIIRYRAPDALFVSGWWSSSYRKAVRAHIVRAERTVLAFDTPFSNSMRLRATAARHSNVFRASGWGFVPGERSFLAARTLGFPEDRVRKGLYGVAASEFEPLYTARIGKPWPRGFLYAGKLVPAKGITTLLEGYRLYRRRVDDPWPLTVCGQGPLEELLRRKEGVQAAGFVQHDRLGDLLKRSGAAVLASRFDPWPLALVEAAASGLPIVCSAACGSHVEVVRDFYNGRVFATSNAASLASCLVWIHSQYDRLPELGKRSLMLADCYSEKETAVRWQELSSLVVST